MKRLITTAIIMALTASPAMATYQEPLPIPEIEVSDGSDGTALLLLLGIGAFIIWHNSKEPTPEPIRPEGCLEKIGTEMVITACPD